MLEIKKFINQEELFETAAKDFLQQAAQSLNNKNFFDVALSGGSTALYFFEKLCLQNISKDILQKTRLFFSDERVVYPDNPKSNAYNASNALLKKGFLKENFFPIITHDLNGQQAAKEYENLLDKLLNKKNSLPCFDLLYLGIGTDGHIASLFPKSELLSFDIDQQVAYFKREDVEFERITFCPNLIINAQKLVFLTCGKEKKEILQKVIHGSYENDKLPAQFIINNSNKAVLFMEECSV